MRNVDPARLPSRLLCRRALLARALLARALLARALLALVLVLPATAGRAGPHEAAGLMGSWCDETGYQLNLTPSAIWFRDLQALEDPPSGGDLAFGGNLAVYTQDFSRSAYPEIGLLACSLSLTGPDRAREQCHGSGTGFRPVIDLTRCPETPIS